MPQPLAVVRRGHAPVLPPVEGTPLLTGAEAPPVPSATPASMEIAVQARLGRMLAPSTDAFRLPDPRTPWVARLKRDQQVAVVSQWQGWFAILMGDGTYAYVPQTHLELLPFMVRTVSSTPASPVQPQFSPLRPASARPPIDNPAQNQLAAAVVEEALRYTGAPYIWGGNSEAGIDCSGLVKNCFSSQGVKLPRRASEQAQVGQDVPLDQLQPGDRLYFSVKKEFDHTGIYLGNGYFIHASMSRGKVGVDHLSTRLYGNSLAAARRL